MYSGGIQSGIKVRDVDFFKLSDCDCLNNCSVVKPSNDIQVNTVFSNTVKAWKCLESLTFNELSHYITISSLNKSARSTLYVYDDKSGKLKPSKAKFNKNDWIVYDVINNSIVKLSESQFNTLFEYKLNQADITSLSALSSAISVARNENSLACSSLW